jgi:hypothetical protein
MQLTKSRSYKSASRQLSPQRRQVEKLDDRSYADALVNKVERLMTKILTAKIRRLIQWIFVDTTTNKNNQKISLSISVVFNTCLLVICSFQLSLILNSGVRKFILLYSRECSNLPLQNSRNNPSRPPYQPSRRHIRHLWINCILPKRNMLTKSLKQTS